MFLQAALSDCNGVLKLLFSLSKGVFRDSNFITGILECSTKLCDSLCLGLVCNVSNRILFSGKGCFTASEVSWVAESLIWVTSPAGTGVVLGRFGVPGVPSILS